MVSAKQKFYIGSFFITTGILFLTIIPFGVDVLNLKVIINNDEIFFSSFICFVIGTIFYLLSSEFYKKQVIWIISLVIYFIVYQFVFAFFRNLFFY